MFRNIRLCLVYYYSFMYFTIMSVLCTLQEVFAEWICIQRSNGGNISWNRNFFRYRNQQSLRRDVIGRMNTRRCLRWACSYYFLVWYTSECFPSKTLLTSTQENLWSRWKDILVQNCCILINICLTDSLQTNRIWFRLICCSVCLVFQNYIPCETGIA